MSKSRRASKISSSNHPNDSRHSAAGYEVEKLTELQFIEEAFMKFEHLLNALALLTDGSDYQEEQLLNQAYTLALESGSTEAHLRLMAEAMHKKWLSDSEFPPIAAKLSYRLADIQAEDITLRSIVLGLIYNDYRDRKSLRSINRSLFCNSASFSFEFFRLFHANSYCRTIDDALPTRRSKGDRKAAQEDVVTTPLNILVEPLMDYLFELCDENSVDAELAVFHRTMFQIGEYMGILEPDKMFDLMLAIRRRIIDIDTSPKYRAMLMELVELYNRNWDPEAVPVKVNRIFLKYRPRSYKFMRWSEKKEVF